MLVCVQDCVRGPLLHIGYIPRSEIVGSHDNSMFNFLRTYQLFCKMAAVLHSHQKCMRVSISSHSHQHLILSVFLNTFIVVHVKWFLRVLVCRSLKSNDVEHLHMSLLDFV